MNDHLNHELGIASRVWFGQGPGGLIQAHLAFGKASASLLLQGAHLCSYVPDGAHELFWLSSTSRFEAGAPVRGGVPVCWPWFGAHPDDPTGPQHGFARNSLFEVIATHANAHHTSISLRLIVPPAYTQWANGVTLDFEIQLSTSLSMELVTTNHGTAPTAVGAALHSYFRVANVREVRIDALTGLQYKDKTQAFAQYRQSDELVINGEVDRVYLNPPARASLRDPGNNRLISITSWGNTDLVVWNPGPEVASDMADFDSDGYTKMVCIEPANALDNIVQLEPGHRHTLGQTIHTEPYTASR